MRASSVGDGGEPPVATRIGGIEAHARASGASASISSTVGAPLKWVTPSARDQLEDPRGVDGPQHDVGAAGGGDRPRKAPAVAVEQRQRPQEDGVALELVGDDLAQGVERCARGGCT